MTKQLIDANTILKQVKPLTQPANETQPYGHLVALPIALAESVCKESVDNLNQLLADTITLRDFLQKAPLAGGGSHVLSVAPSLR